jgi:hypothetical protein
MDLDRENDILAYQVVDLRRKKFMRIDSKRQLQEQIDKVESELTKIK